LSARRAVLESYKPAPAWMTEYVKTLATITQHTRPWRVVVTDQAFFDALGKGKAEGALMQTADGGDVIIMPERAVNTNYWSDILAHEFAHAWHSQIDRMVVGLVDFEQYEAEVEHFAKVFGGLAQFAALHGRFRTDGSPAAMVWHKEEPGE
jgi:hypothetical protein